MDNRDTARGRGQWQGGKWCRPSTRLAVYLRDGMACTWCGHSVEQGAALTLDHVIPASRGGSNATGNLIACCERCNRSRGTRSIPDFAAAVAEYLDHGVTAGEIGAHVHATRRRTLPRAEARELIARRGSAARVLTDMRA